jgi:hypothetical protein
MVIVLLSIIILPIAWAQGHYAQAMGYALGIISGALFYCLMLKWQPWASRLHTPLFALAAPLMAIAVTSGTGIFTARMGHLFIVSMILYSLPFALTNSNRSLASLDWSHNDRMPLYFNERRYLFNDYNQAMSVLKEADAAEVGLYLGGDDWEYPFWAFAKRNGSSQKTMTFRHVGIGNVSRAIQKDVFLPLYVIATRPLDTWEHASKYTSVYASDHATVFVKSGDQAYSSETKYRF